MKARTVHIITKLELGGAQEVALYTARHLRRDLYSVTFVSGEGGVLTQDARSIPEAEYIEVPELVRNISPLKDFMAFVRLYRIIRGLAAVDGGSILVHTHSSKAGILGRLAAYAAGARVIVHTIHGFGFNDEQGWLRRNLFVSLEKIAGRATSSFVAVAYENIKKGVANGIFKEDKAVVVRCGIDTAHFAESPADPDAKRKELGLPEGAPVVTMVACLKPQKAPVDFVKVAAKVLGSVPDAHFLLAGDGELRGDVLAEAEKLGISERFHLLGWRRDVRDIMHLSDVVVLTSLWEGLPKVVPQAMAAGRPVVATAVDGTPEAIKDGVNGFLARPHDVEYMAEKVSLLLKDKELARSMGEAGRRMVRGFDEREMLRGIEALYERLLGGAV